MVEQEIIKWTQFARELDQDALGRTDPYKICYQLGLDVVTRDTDNDGYLICAAGCKFIIVSSQIGNRHRRRFITAHEIGHFLMHGESMYCCRDLYDSDIERLNSTSQEYQANVFASELLLPEDQLKRLSPSSSICFSDISRVADIMDVSMTMCARKMVRYSKEGTETLLYYADDKLIWCVSNDDEIPEFANKFSKLESATGKIQKWRAGLAQRNNVEVFSPVDGHKMVLISDSKEIFTKDR